MKKFVFELQSLYDIKKRSESLEKKNMMNIEEKIREHARKLSGMQKEFADTNDGLKKEMSKAVNVHMLNQYNGYLTKLTLMMKRQNKIIRAENERKALVVKKLIEIQKEIKSLENLRERKYEEYLVEAKKEEEKAIEDIMSYKIAAS